MISAFGVDHGEVSKGLRLLRGGRTRPAQYDELPGFKPRGAGADKPFTPSRDRARAKKKPTIESKREWYAQQNKYLATGRLPTALG